MILKIFQNDKNKMETTLKLNKKGKLVRICEIGNVIWIYFHLYLNGVLVSARSSPHQVVTCYLRHSCSSVEQGLWLEQPRRGINEIEWIPAETKIVAAILDTAWPTLVTKWKWYNPGRV